MKKALRDQWVADLIANPHLQGRGGLSRYELDCCLGRLAKLCGVPQTDQFLDGSVVFGFGLEAEATGLPPAEWSASIGLPLEARSDLATKNDEGMSFPELAQLITQIVPLDPEEDLA